MACPAAAGSSLAGSGWRGGAHNALLRWSKGQQEMPLHTAACMPSRLQPGSLGPTHSLHCHPPCVALPNPALTVVPRCSTSAPPSSRSAPVWRVSTWPDVGAERRRDEAALLHCSQLCRLLHTTHVRTPVDQHVTSKLSGAHHKLLLHRAVLHHLPVGRRGRCRWDWKGRRACPQLSISSLPASQPAIRLRPSSSVTPLPTCSTRSLTTGRSSTWTSW